MKRTWTAIAAQRVALQLVEAINTEGATVVPIATRRAAWVWLLDVEKRYAAHDPAYTAIAPDQIEAVTAARRALEDLGIPRQLGRYKTRPVRHYKPAARAQPGGAL